MITLKELVNSYGCVLTDLEIISLYFDKNNMEEQGIQLMETLATSKIKKLNDELRSIKGNVSMFVPCHFKGVPEELQNRLERATLYTMINVDIPKDLLEILREQVPKIKRPPLFWNDLEKLLNENDIYFKGTKK